MQLLDIVERLQASRRAGTTITVDDLASRLNVSLASLHRNVNSCVNSGFMEVRTHTHSNGARLANSYHLTEFGRTVLGSAREARVAGLGPAE